MNSSTCEVRGVEFQPIVSTFTTLYFRLCIGRDPRQQVIVNLGKNTRPKSRECSHRGERKWRPQIGRRFFFAPTSVGKIYVNLAIYLI